MRIVLGLLFAVAATGAPSRQPPQPVGQQARPETNQSTHTTQDAKEDKRGTSELPLEVKTYAQQSKQEAADEQDDRRERASTDWWVIFIGKMTALILLVQAIVFWIQAGRLKETIAAMNKIANDQRTDIASSIAVAKDAAQAAQDTAAAAKIQTETSRKEFVLTQRPRIIVRLFDWKSDPEQAYWFIRFTCANVGGTRASIKAIRFGFLQGDELRGIPNYSLPSNIASFSLDPGQSSDITEQTNNRSIRMGDATERPLQPYSLKRLDSNEYLFFFGFIDYADDIGVVRRTAFARWWNTDTAQFELRDNYNYEYAD